MRRALITGILGQDGAYLAELLLANDYEVLGLARCRSGLPARTGLDYLGIRERVTVLPGDVTDAASVRAALRHVRPTEVYNLAAQTSVGDSWSSIHLTTEVNAVGALNVMSAVLEVCPDAAVLQASTSEMHARGTPAAPARIHETSPTAPSSPYGASKLYAHDMARLFREARGLRAWRAVMFNHDSPLRHPGAVSRKIAIEVAGLVTRRRTRPLRLGSLDSGRDRAHARDMARGMWRMLQTARPDDYVLATGVLSTVRDFVEDAFHYAGRTISWHGSGLDEVGLDAATGERLVEIDPALVRPADALVGVANKARAELGWQPTVRLPDLIGEMVSAELAAQPPAA